ncbi:MAG: hypothetical protein J5605_02035, partial [Bacteroidales bacterium]|nr:hypothetical protein [Bacteroidales bacterium]
DAEFTYCFAADFCRNTNMIFFIWNRDVQVTDISFSLVSCCPPQGGRLYFANPKEKKRTNLKDNNNKQHLIL